MLWTATASCITQSDIAQRAGEAMIDNIFDNADKNRVGDAGCPLVVRRFKQSEESSFMPRLAPLDLDKLTPEQKKVADAIVAGPRGGLRGPFDPWLRSPGWPTARRSSASTAASTTRCPRTSSELAICLVGRHFKAQFEFYAHARLAREAGLAPAIVEAVRTRATPPFTRDVERVVYDFVTEYLETNRVAAPNYKRAIDAFGEQGVVDLVGVCGYYMLVSMTLNVFEMPLPPGEPDPLV